MIETFFILIISIIVILTFVLISSIFLTEYRVDFHHYIGNTYSFNKTKKKYNFARNNTEFIKNITLKHLNNNNYKLYTLMVNDKIELYRPECDFSTSQNIIIERSKIKGDHTCGLLIFSLPDQLLDSHYEKFDDEINIFLGDYLFVLYTNEDEVPKINLKY